jgi:ribitol 2-dehydrogenase
MGDQLLCPDGAASGVQARHSRGLSLASPGHQRTRGLARPEKLKQSSESGSLREASQAANVVMFILTRPRGIKLRDVVMLPTNFHLLWRSAMF